MFFYSILLSVTKGKLGES